MLSGEKLQKDDYSKRAEENMLNLLKEKEAVPVMGFFSKSDALGTNLAVVFLAPVYALLINLVLIPIDKRLQKH